MEPLRDRSAGSEELILSRRPEAADSAVLLFQIGAYALALQIDSVVQVIPMLKLVPLPQKHPVIEGFANIRGQLIPVIAVRQILGLPVLEPQLNTPILLTFIQGQLIGLIVDEVNDVATLPAEQITRPEALLPKNIESVVVLLGVAYIDNQPVFLIDLDHLLNPAQAQALNRAIESLSEQIDGRGKSRRRRKNLSAALADQVAIIALDLPPVDGAFSPLMEGPQPDSET